MTTIEKTILRIKNHPVIAVLVIMSAVLVGLEVTNQDVSNWGQFRLIGGASIISGGSAIVDWQTYSGTINIKINKGSTANFEYYSVDNNNNTEITKAELLQ